MIFEIDEVEVSQLSTLAARQGREVGALLHEAIREYLEAAATTDLSPGDIGEAQMALVGELSHLPSWGSRKP